VADDAGVSSPELDRLARVVSAADWGTPVEAARPVNDDYRIAAAVLADLRDRYVLTPRGANMVESEDVEVFDPKYGQWKGVSPDPQHLTPLVAWPRRRRTRVTLCGPWREDPS